jgi:carbamoyl-phosphate synthase large subunit
MKTGTLQLAIYTTMGSVSFGDEKAIRRAAIQYRVPCITTMSAAKAAAEAMEAKQTTPNRVWSLQEIHAK